MNFQQLRSVRETIRCNFNLTDVAEVLHTSQPGVSRQIRELEEELGFELFIRSGKRLTGLTVPGEHVLPIIENILLSAANLKTAGQDLDQSQHGMLSIAATHSQARYALPLAVEAFRAKYPNVSLHLHQGSPRQVAEMLLSGDADVGVATEALDHYDELVVMPSYQWAHSIIVPPGHPLLENKLDVERLAEFPLITYENGFTGRTKINQAFSSKNLSPNIVLSAMDADVIKTYVQLGLGVGVVASIAYDPERDQSLRAIDAGHIFGINQTKVAVLKNNYLRGYTYSFIEAFFPALNRETVEKAQVEKGGFSTQF
ncbi:LysR family cys regulon transcriptional activator [Jezberella montanilacus]|uniref:LysR family cys regulon transcriptional activator n=1 Tax=Jezberella montanilacus TaxID=323426 RepID=A0A2T0XD69_9BURK|nr:CysB family HTH-type transcriptional regulator [Jezberella montanilacus]PRY96850.1 LysR family cys regulon transcriptional activator [Jezberella montanilacus]|eukprot:gene8312-8397_t